MNDYKIDQIIIQDHVKWRVSALTNTFVIVTRVGAPVETDNHLDIRKINI